MTTAMVKAATVVEGFRPGYLGRIAQMHGEYYAGVLGTGAELESLVAQELAAFQSRYDPACDLLLTAHVGGILAGCVALDGGQTEHPGVRLRWFLLDAAYQGQGIGSDLLRRALEGCRGHGFERVWLWTVEGLPSALHLYAKVGFRVVERFSDARYTVPLVNLRMEKELL